MNKRIRIINILIIFIVLTTLLCSCPYSSNTALSKPDTEPEDFFYGKWLNVNELADFPHYFQIIRKDKFRFTAERYEFNFSTSLYEKTNSLICFFTDIESTRFINIKQDGLFYFYKLELISENEFKLYEVTDNITEIFYRSRDINAFFRNNKDLSFFYNKDVENYIKVE